MILSPSDVLIATTSDIHLGHPRVQTHHIIESLYQAFPDNEETARLDILFIAGDVFDRLLSLPQVEVDLIQAWITDILYLCSKYNIRVRVLEGTPSHDWRQSKQFQTVAGSMGKSAPDFRYVDTLSIEIIKELGDMSVLYVPDEWNADASVTLEQVRELLALHGLSQVDVAVMHGAFDYQLPIQSSRNHDSRAYMELVKHFIFIGHVHTRTELAGKILAQGSLDRLSFGEEAPKGHYRACISENGNFHWFVENKNARIFKTIDCRGMTVAETMECLKDHENCPDQSAFRLLINRDSTIRAGIRELRKAYPQFRIETHQDEIKTTVRLDNVQVEVVKPMSITATNIGHIVTECLLNKPSELDNTTVDDVLRILKKYDQ